MADKSTYRCAVYTRKSHEEGLDQDFNSLDAQSEACKAYVASQAGLGWSLRDKAYDDGGISGGHMERPALQSLIADIKAGLIDVIVVYKVDRLTRSLTDFSKLVDVFDAHDVSFVSVTQAFNTTTSMGRLTLNVLLSFAQFEREVTAERIRDKIAASKAKGMWMGGNVPLGYRSENKRLHVDESEAETIKTVFNLYLKHQNVRLLKQESDSLGLTTRLRTGKTGTATGGKSFSRGHIYRILTNPIYIGKIQHKAKVYDGEHASIIASDIWDDVQDALKANAAKRTVIGNSKSPTLLAGLIIDADGEKLVPHHANKKGHRYYYYVSQRLKTGDRDSGWRVPAKTLEAAVIDTLTHTFKSTSELLPLLPLSNKNADTLQSFTVAAGKLAKDIIDASHLDLKALLNNLIKSINLETAQISIDFDAGALQQKLDVSLPEDAAIVLTKPMTIRRRGQEMKMLIGGQEQTTPNYDPVLVKLVARAHALRVGLESGTIASIKEFAASKNMDHADAKRILPLGYLAPDIVEAIADGRQPSDLTALSLKNGYDLPMLWSKQRAKLGFRA